MLIVTGIHRSGTTFTGRLLQRAGIWHYLHEPFNRDYGIKGVPYWYPYAAQAAIDNPDLECSIQDLAVMRLRFRMPPNLHGIKRILRLSLHSRGHWDYCRWHYLGRRKPLLLKDPFLSLCAGSVLDRTQQKGREAKVIYLIRHPVAVYRSLCRMDWHFDGQQLFRQTALRQTYLRAIPERVWHSTQRAEQLAWLWHIVYRVIADECTRLGKDRALLLRHEDVCLNPLSSMRRVFRFLGQDAVPATVQAFIRQYMQGERTQAQGKKLHDFTRNAAELAWSWCRQPLHAEEGILLDVNGDLLHDHYRDCPFV